MVAHDAAVVLLVLTKCGIPVSTTFLVLTIFALTGGSDKEGFMERILIKSGLGYVVPMAGSRCFPAR